MEHEFFPLFKPDAPITTYVCKGCELTVAAPLGVTVITAQRMLKEEYRGRTCDQSGGGTGQ